ncbi:MAG: hypothetical protein ACQERN_12030 [Thermodesulfobacteriota bacterium]
MTPETAEANLRIVRQMGCASVHISGGEPMLNTRALVSILEAARKTGVGIGYVETNSSWYTQFGGTVSLFDEVISGGMAPELLRGAYPYPSSASRCSLRPM